MTGGGGEMYVRRRMMRALRMTRLLALASFVGLAGCTNLNEGAVEHFRVAMPTTKPACPLCCEKGCENGKLQILAKYVRQEDHEINKGDTIAIDLKQVFIKGFKELFGDAFGTKRGEIAIVANVYEMDNSEEKRLIKYGEESKKGGRLVFFTDDARPGQFLNMSQIPLYGPIRYNGNRLVLQFYIIELDGADNAQLKSMLGMLSSIGGAAHPPSAPILGLLESLGSALIAKNGDDTEFAYTMTLLPEQPNPVTHPDILTAGEYVLARKEDRTIPMDPGVVRYNPENGRLYGKDGTAPYRDDTYITVQIVKDFSDDVSLDLRHVVFSEFLSSLDTDIVKRETAFTTLASKTAAKVKELINFRRAKSRIGTLSETGVDAAEAESKADELVTILGDALAKETTETPTLGSDEIDSLIGDIRRLAFKADPVIGKTVTRQGLADPTTRDAIAAALSGRAQGASSPAPVGGDAPAPTNPAAAPVVTPLSPPR